MDISPMKKAAESNTGSSLPKSAGKPAKPDPKAEALRRNLLRRKQAAKATSQPQSEA